MSKPHFVFTFSFQDGVARALQTPGVFHDPITKKSIHVEHMIWDTGATNTCITPRVAQLLGLTPIGMTRVHTAAGEAEVNQYLVQVELKNGVTFQPIRVSEANLGPGADALIGMDIIASGDFIVQNCGGKTEFSFCIPPFDNKYNMIEKANIINARVAKTMTKKP